MHQLHSSDLSALENFIVNVPTNGPMLRAFLEGRVPGHAFVDTLPAPTAAVVAVNYRFVFFGGAPSRAFQEQAIRQLRYQQALEVVWPAPPAKLPHGPVPDQVIARMEFRRRHSPSTGHLEQLANRAPHAEVKRIDSRTIGQCLWREDVLRATGSTSEFLGHGLGFSLWVDESIVAEAYAVIWSGSRAEIATVTHPRHRGRGYATVVCASLIKACEAVDIDTYWNCDVANESSMRLAARLGYQQPHEYRLVRFSQQAPVAKFQLKKKPSSSWSTFTKRWFGRARLVR